MKEHTIKTVESGSIAEELELEPGDILLSINNEEIEDIFDYRFIIKDEYLEVVIRKKNEEEWILEIHFVHASDEWYINAEREFPGEDRYDGYVQLENGVGMMRIFVDEFEYALEQLTNSKEYPKLREKLQRVVTIAVGKLSYPTMKKFTEQLEILFPGLTINI